MNTSMAKQSWITRRSMGAASAVAALGLVLTGCGGQNTPTAETTTTTSTVQQTTPADGSTASAQGTDNPFKKDVAGSPEQVYAAIATAQAAAPDMKAYKYDFDNTKHEVQVTDGKKEQQITVSTDGKTAEKTGTDGLGSIVNDREDIVKTKVDMTTALKTALTRVPGTPDEAKLDRDHEILKDHLGWIIKVVDAKDKEHKVIVDALSGKIVKVDIDH